MDQEGLLHHAQTRVERHTKGRRVSSCPDAHSHPHGRAGRALDLLPSVGVGGARDVTGDSIFFFFFRSRPKFFSRVAPPTPLAWRKMHYENLWEFEHYCILKRCIMWIYVLLYTKSWEKEIYVNTCAGINDEIKRVCLRIKSPIGGLFTKGTNDILWYIYIYDIHITGYQIRMTLLSKIRLAAGLRGKFTQRKLLERDLCTGHFGVPSDRTETWIHFSAVSCLPSISMILGSVLSVGGTAYRYYYCHYYIIIIFMIVHYF